MTTEVIAEKPTHVHFMVRRMNREVKNEITIHSKAQGMHNGAFLEALWGIYTELMEDAPKSNTSRALLERRGLSHVKKGKK